MGVTDDDDDDDDDGDGDADAAADDDDNDGWLMCNKDEEDAAALIMFEFWFWRGKIEKKHAKGFTDEVIDAEVDELLQVNGAPDDEEVDVAVGEI
jgi:hypothetical protein